MMIDTRPDRRTSPPPVFGRADGHGGALMPVLPTPAGGYCLHRAGTWKTNDGRWMCLGCGRPAGSGPYVDLDLMLALGPHPTDPTKPPVPPDDAEAVAKAIVAAGHPGEYALLLTGREPAGAGDGGEPNADAMLDGQLAMTARGARDPNGRLR